MTKKELIKKLELFSDDAEVIAMKGIHGNWDDIDLVQSEEDGTYAALVYNADGSEPSPFNPSRGIFTTST